MVNPEFRQNAIANLKNKRLKDFWEFEFNKAGDFQRVKMSSGINTRIERFLFSEIARRVMEDYISTINFEQIMDEGKILICNFSKGKLGEDNMRLFGTMVLGEIQLATQKRARKELESRRDFFVYVDEFQNFATRSFVDMMAESRKYGVYVTIVEQSTSQQRDRDVVNIIFANVGTFICFKNSNTADEELILPIFKPYVSEGEIFNLPTYRFYVKISAVNPQEPFSGETILPKIAGSKKRLEEVIRVTRQKYAPLYVKPKEPQKVVTNENKNDKPNKSSQHIPSVSELV